MLCSRVNVLRTVMKGIIDQLKMDKQDQDRRFRMRFASTFFWWEDGSA